MEEKTIPEIKVSDIVDFTEKDFTETKTVIQNLMKLTENYIKMGDIGDLDGLERIKRDFIGYLQRYTVLYSKVKRYKGSSHTYLEEARKRAKAIAIKDLIDGGMNATNAKNTVYDSDIYLAHQKALASIGAFFIKVEELYGQFDKTLRAIIQSISVQSKEKSYLNHGD
jgi:hypothetical protein